jgi:hypothetical protein
MPKTNIYHGTNISELTELERLADGIKGYWLKDWGVCRLSVVRGHAFLSTDIMGTDTAISMTLPTHQPFYAMVLSSNGSRTVLINDNINLTLNAGEQLQAIFTLEK